jgi:hypothetical protein
VIRNFDIRNFVPVPSSWLPASLAPLHSKLGLKKKRTTLLLEPSVGRNSTRKNIRIKKIISAREKMSTGQSTIPKFSEF